MESGIAVFCGSSSGTDPAYVDLARSLGAEIAQRGRTLVYGGGDVGLMGAAADAAMTAGESVLGVIPRNLFRREVVHRGLTQLIEVDSMHERKAIMYDRSSSVIGLPGGLGTLEELFEVATWNQLGLLDPPRPIVLLAPDDYFAPLVSFLDSAVERGFVKAKWRATIHHASDPATAIDILDADLDVPEPQLDEIPPERMSDTGIVELRASLAEVADPERAEQMAAYMKDQFAFFGIPATVRRKAQRGFRDRHATSNAAGILDAADGCWAEPERELQYVATDLLRAHAATLPSGALSRVRRLVATKSWWDTVDALAAHVVGPMVQRDPHLVASMDHWIDDDDIWIARTAILHQLGWKERTDADRLFAYVERRASDTEFFIRKAIGWALRDYARTDPDGVLRFVDRCGDRLSGLTRREALKHLSA